MRDGKCFQCGDAIKGIEPRFFVGAAANPFGDPFEWRPLRLAKKVKAGANFIQTQLIYNVPRFADFMERVRKLGTHREVFLLAGIGPLKSPGMAKYMRDEVPGLDVPDEYVDRMTASADGIDKEDKKARGAAWKAEGIRIAIELIGQMRQIEGVAGDPPDGDRVGGSRAPDPGGRRVAAAPRAGADPGRGSGRGLKRPWRPH